MSDIDLSQKQSDAWHFLEDTETTELLYGGGAGGGKSMLGCLWHITRRVKYKESRGLIGRKELKSIKESTLITFFKVCRLLGYQADKHYKFNATDMVIVWANGSRTVFRELDYQPSDENYERLGSTEYTDVFVDEAGEITEKAFDIINSRIRWMLSDYGLVPKILLTCNPNNNWIKRKYIKDKEGNRVSLKPYQRYVRALVMDNPDKDFVQIYKQQLDKLSSTYDKARLLDGDWDATPKTGGEFYKLFDYDRDTLINPMDEDLPVLYDPTAALHITFDFNVAPYITACVHQVRNKHAIQIDEFCYESPKNRTSIVCDGVAERYREHTAGMFIYGDPAGVQEDTRTERGENDFVIIMRKLRGFRPSLRITKAAPPVVMRGNFLNDVFDKGEGGCSIIVGRNCINSVNDYLYLKEAMDGTKDKKKTKNPVTGITSELYGHTSDANEYFHCWIFAAEFANYAKSTGVPGKRTLGKKQSKNAY